MRIKTEIGENEKKITIIANRQHDNYFNDNNCNSNDSNNDKQRVTVNKSTIQILFSNMCL